MRFDINNYKGKYVMHCKTEAEAKEFCDYLHSIGRRWISGSSYNNTTHWDDYREDTCYAFNNGMYFRPQSAREENYTILEWSDFTTEFTKADLKDGMVVECANGDRYLVVNSRLLDRSGWLSLNTYTDDLKYKKWTINAVYESYACCLDMIFKDATLTLIWERKKKPEPVEMTLAEVCKVLGKEIKIVKEC